MIDRKPPVWPLALMLIWYGLLLVGAGIALLIILSFGSEAYRDRGIPLAELLPVLGPFVLIGALIFATIWLWNAGKHKITYALCGLSVLFAFAGISLFGIAI